METRRVGRLPAKMPGVEELKAEAAQPLETDPLPWEGSQRELQTAVYAAVSACRRVNNGGWRVVRLLVSV